MPIEPARVPRRSSFFFWWRSGSKWQTPASVFPTCRISQVSTPETPASRFLRKAGRESPFGLASPMPVITMRGRSDNLVRLLEIAGQVDLVDGVARGLARRQHELARRSTHADLQRRADGAREQAAGIAERALDGAEHELQDRVGDLERREDRPQREDARILLAVALAHVPEQRAHGLLEVPDDDLLAAAEHRRDDGQRVADGGVEVAAARGVELGVD